MAKERDFEETGFYYYGSRYYASWLGRWTSCDRAGYVDGLNLYAFVKDNPVRFSDQKGFQSSQDFQLNPALSKLKPSAEAEAAEGHVMSEDDLRDRIKPDTANPWFSSMVQGLGVSDPTVYHPGGWIDQEAELTGNAIMGTGFHQLPVYGGGIVAQWALHYQVPQIKGFDVGYTGSAALSSMGANTGDILSRGVSAAGLMHLGAKSESGLGGALYLQAGGMGNRQGDGGWMFSPTVSATGVFGGELDGPPNAGAKLASWSINGVANWSLSGSLPVGPQMQNVVGLGGVLGFGVNFGEKGLMGLTAEGSLMHTSGSPDPSSGGQTASSWAGKVGGVFNMNNTIPWGPGNAGGSVGFGAWLGLERGNVTGPGNIGSPPGPFTNFTAIFQLSFSLRGH
jgi:RHS repeat-associated protein